MYTEDDSKKSLMAIEIIARWFIFALVDRKIPVRGALACKEFYSDRSNSLFLGEALLEAYKWGENQDWIGYIICPSAVEKLKEFDHIRELQNYINHDVPFKKSPESVQNILACILGDMIRPSNGENFLLKKLKEMRSKNTNPNIRQKYDRTINFLLQ
jgi:hypothetical protein